MTHRLSEETGRSSIWNQAKLQQILSNITYRSFATTVSQQQCHNSKLVIFQEKCLKVLKCNTFLWVQRRHSCSPAAAFKKLLYSTIPVKSASANVYFYTNNSKMPNFELWNFCRKWEIWCFLVRTSTFIR